MPITHPTVLVLGAGASADVGYPTGKDLTNRICIKLSTKNNTYKSSALFKAAVEAGFSEDEVVQFGRDFHDSQVLSIDDFLSENLQWHAVGKFCIAHELIEVENEEALKEMGRNAWYRQLRHALGNGLEQLRQSKLKIITFNYDRSLEHFLFTSYRSISRATAQPTGVRECLNNLEFLHIHGQIGSLEWQEGGHRPYGPAKSAMEIREQSRRILIVDESENQRYLSTPPWEIIEWAEQVLFIGFGFAPSNMARLGMERFKKNEKIGFGATTMGLAQVQLSTLKSDFGFKPFDGCAALFGAHVLDDPIKPVFGQTKLITVKR